MPFPLLLTSIMMCVEVTFWLHCVWLFTLCTMFTFAFLYVFLSRSAFSRPIIQPRLPQMYSYAISSKPIFPQDKTTRQMNGSDPRRRYTCTCTVLALIKLTKFAVALRLRCGSCKLIFFTLFCLFSLNLRTLYIVWRLVRRRVTRRLTRLQTMCNVLKYS